MHIFLIWVHTFIALFGLCAYTWLNIKWDTMQRIMAMDYGTKRVGVAVSDPTRTIAVPLQTIVTRAIFSFLKAYTTEESVALFVIGLPKSLSNKLSPMTTTVQRFVQALKHRFPTQDIILQDERYTSRIAQKSLYIGGFKRKDRQHKENVDKISATLILQSFLSAQKIHHAS